MKSISMNKCINRLATIGHMNFDYLIHKKEFMAYEKRDIFDIDNLPFQLHGPRIEWVERNQYYGVEKVLRDYMGSHAPINAFVEHGLMDRGQIETQEIIESNRKRIITYSLFRKEQYESVFGTQYKICVIGPYIKYSPSFYNSDEMRQLKQEYGRILTFFPFHTTDGDDTNRDETKIEKVINIIEEYRKELNVDTVFICGYWRDIYVGALEKFKTKDYVIVSAGHGMSQRFLSRLKSIIELSDYTLSDEFGTHVVYSTCLGVPHVIIQNREDQSKNNETKFFQWLIPEFYSFDQFESNEQKHIQEYVFGNVNTVSRDQLRTLLYC